MWLDDARACDVDLAGAKAANLARAARHGLPVLPGFVLTTHGTDGPQVAASARGPLRQAWERLSAAGEVPLVVRSSSTVEDATTSSMAGQFTSLLDIRGWSAFLDAVDAVLASAGRPHDAVTRAQPMAVLVQPLLQPTCGGVLFGLDPVTGDRRHIIVEAVPGTPDVLVRGTVTAVHVVLGRRGRSIGATDPSARSLLRTSRRRRLAHLARNAAAAFDGPQDVEWAFDADDRLWLLQARAVTAYGPAAQATGPVLGPGPVAETFPDPLRPLEVDLWVDPLRAGVVGALHVTGAVGRRRVATSPVVTAVGGRVAADLELFGIVPRRGPLRTLNPVPGARRLMASWRVGRLRSALPGLAGDLIAMVDGDLHALGDVADLTDGSLLLLLDRAGMELVALHGHEVLAGMLLPAEGDRSAAGAIALDALRRGRADSLSDDEIIARDPVVLALIPPSLGPPAPLPTVTIGGGTLPTAGALGWREGLRLRARWVQELSARVGLELGERLAARGVLERADLVRELRLDEVRRAITERWVPADLGVRAATPPGAPLPMAFRLAASSTPIAWRVDHATEDGRAASAGRAIGVACHDPADLPRGEATVLVVDTLDPRLATALPHIDGLVAETGSALSHLAILAREMHVPAVVAVPDARARFPDGSRVLVDGGTGEVRGLTAEDPT